MSTEYQELKEVVSRFRDRWQEHSASLRPSMNGLSWGGPKGAIMWNQMMAIGADKGDPDFVLLIPKGGYCGLVIEHKGENQSHKLTEEQETQLTMFEGLGYCTACTRGTEPLWAAIVTYMEQ